MSTKIQATCHCGGITVEVPRKPDYINDCQCGICRRYGAGWAYYDLPDVKIIRREGASTKKYIWGDRLLEFHFCNECGCMVYWWPIAGSANPSEDMGINTRMMELELLEGIERKQIPPGEDY